MEPPEEIQPCRHLDFSPLGSISDFWPPKQYENRLVFFWTITLVVICYSSHRKIAYSECSKRLVQNEIQMTQHREIEGQTRGEAVAATQPWGNLEAYFSSPFISFLTWVVSSGLASDIVRTGSFSLFFFLLTSHLKITEVNYFGGNCGFRQDFLIFLLSGEKYWFLMSPYIFLFPRVWHTPDECLH